MKQRKVHKQVLDGRVIHQKEKLQGKKKPKTKQNKTKNDQNVTNQLQSVIIFFFYTLQD